MEKSDYLVLYVDSGHCAALIEELVMPHVKEINGVRMDVAEDERHGWKTLLKATAQGKKYDMVISPSFYNFGRYGVKNVFTAAVANNGACKLVVFSSQAGCGSLKAAVAQFGNVEHVAKRGLESISAMGEDVAKAIRRGMQEARLAGELPVGAIEDARRLGCKHGRAGECGRKAPIQIKRGGQ